jgi:hypothetical protein
MRATPLPARSLAPAHDVLRASEASPREDRPTAHYRRRSRGPATRCLARICVRGVIEIRDLAPNASLAVSGRRDRCGRYQPWDAPLRVRLTSIRRKIFSAFGSLRTRTVSPPSLNVASISSSSTSNGSLIERDTTPERRSTYRPSSPLSSSWTFFSALMVRTSPETLTSRRRPAAER